MSEASDDGEQLVLPDPDLAPPILPEGGEDETDLGSHDPNEFRAALSSTDWTVETIVNQMRKGRIDLNPRFQRRNAWLDARKSQLIESIMLRYPIPQLVLAESREAPGSYIVIDGKQRLLALRQFCVDEGDERDAPFDGLTLRGLEILDSLNGTTWAEVEGGRPDMAANFENHTIRTVLLSDWSSEDLLLSLFLRLNTGSVTLSPQELRQALHPGPFTDWIDERSANSEGLKNLLGIAQPDRRMIDAELLLRYVALRHSPLAYRSNLKRFLDDSSGLFNRDWMQWRSQLEAAALDLEAGVQVAISVFGEGHACRRWNANRFERPFNRALFDIEVMALADHQQRDAASADGPTVVQAFKDLCDSDPAFVRSITVTTKTGTAFRTRFEAWERVLRDVTGLAFALPTCLYQPDSS